MSIHTFGDSHASKFHSRWDNYDNIKTHHLGHILCYSFGKEILNICNIENCKVKLKNICIYNVVPPVQNIIQMKIKGIPILVVMKK